ncbi:hypothetical protein [Terrabacter terrigena]|uniref:DUF2516 domain-containing protein n=1 Tax=Terrabacter terrigena TaxID=574718 RepID=A0ABW3N0V5_9MICO
MTPDLPPPIPGLLMAGLLLDVICALECWVFVWMYRPIKKSPEGRHLYRLSRLLGIIFTLTVAFAWLPALAFNLGGMRALIAVMLGGALVQIVLLVYMAAELWVRIDLLRTNQRIAHGRGEHPPPDDAAEPLEAPPSAGPYA